MSDSKFDFDALYKKYPRRGEGKKAGMAKINKTIKTPEEFERFSQAVGNYIALCEKYQLKREFVKYWSTFCNNWEDYESAEELGLVEDIKKGLRVIS